MGNPALELAGLLESWNVDTGKTVHQARGNRSNTPSLTLWEEVAKAVRLLAELDRILELMSAKGEDVADFRVALKACYTAVFQPDVAWNQNHQSGLTMLSPDDMATLRIFGRLIAAEGLVGSISSDSLQAIIGSLTEIEDVIGDLDVSELVRHRLLWHVQQARMFADDVDRFGEEVVIQTAANVASETFRFVNDETVGEEPAGRLKRAAGTILVTVAGSTMSAGVLAAAPHILKALGAGP